MQGEIFVARNPGELRTRLDNFGRMVEEQNIFPVFWKWGKYDKARSLDQNSIIHALYSDIAKQREGEGVIDVRRRCKLHFGVVILRAHDEEFRGIYDKIIRPHEYEDKLKIMDFLPVTSRMKKPQASEYIDTVIREYSELGVDFTDARRELHA